MKKDIEFIIIITSIIGIVFLFGLIFSEQNTAIVGKAIEITCTDSDNGINREILGSVYGKNPSNGVWQNKVDFCNNEGKQCEFYCGDNEYWLKDCEFCVCLNGKCV